GRDAFSLRDERAVKISTALLTKTQRAFLHQAVKERLDGLGMPIVARGQRINDILGGQGRLKPENFHDLPFGFGNERFFFHTLDYSCNCHYDYACNRKKASRICKIILAAELTSES